MAERTVQLVLHYDGAGFKGWQRQPDKRTVQGVVEQALERLCGAPIPALGSGRTDAGVHARGQAVGVRLPERWDPPRLRRALNAVLPDDVWAAAAFEIVSGRSADLAGLTLDRVPDEGVVLPRLLPSEWPKRAPRPGGSR